MMHPASSWLYPESGHQSVAVGLPESVESRCDAVALGSNISVSAPFVRRCLTGSTMAPFSHLAHRTGRADSPHPALGQDLTPSPTARRAQACSGVRAQSAAPSKLQRKVFLRKPAL